MSVLWIHQQSFWNTPYVQIFFFFFFYSSANKIAKVLILIPQKYLFQYFKKYKV